MNHHAQYITALFASCRVTLPPSEIMETNLELEQVDRLFQSSVEQSLTTQVRVTNSDGDEKVSTLGVFASVGSADWLKKLDPISPGPEGSPRNVVGAVSKSWSRRLLKEC